MQAIKIKNLTKHFGKTKAIDDISMNVEKGETFGFLGPNGAGKTTTIRCLMDFIRPTTGSIAILGKDAHREGVELKKHIGYLSGNVHLYQKWTGMAHINFLRRINKKSDIANKLIEKFDFNPDVKTKNLSSGNRQKLGIIMAMMFEPEILIFDEPTNALDPLLQNEVYELIEEAAAGGTTIFMSSHNLAEVERVCDKVGIIKKGKMVAVENITTLKQKKIYSVSAAFENTYDIKDFKAKNIEILKHTDNHLHLKVKGEINKTIHQLSEYKLKDLNVTQATLEDIFLEFYQND